jgi:hypothetical protein
MMAMAGDGSMGRNLATLWPLKPMHCLHIGNKKVLDPWII